LNNRKLVSKTNFSPVEGGPIYEVRGEPDGQESFCQKKRPGESRKEGEIDTFRTREGKESEKGKKKNESCKTRKGTRVTKTVCAKRKRNHRPVFLQGGPLCFRGGGKRIPNSNHGAKWGVTTNGVDKHPKRGKRPLVTRHG